MLGGQIEGDDFEEMIDSWVMTGLAINRIYKEVKAGREGVQLDNFVLATGGISIV